MAVRNVVYLVFLLPVVISIGFGVFVLSNVLGQPDRELNMWPFGNAKLPIQIGDKNIKLENLLRYYSTSTPVNVKVVVNDTNFDCGDLYITIYNGTISSKQAIAQNAFFSQCFAETKSLMPINDTFSQIINKAGQYQIVAQMNDKNSQNTLTTQANFTVQ